MGGELDRLWGGVRKREGGERGKADLGGDGSLGGHHDKRSSQIASKKKALYY